MPCGSGHFSGLSMVLSVWSRYHLLSCRFQLTVEVFDYMDAELRLAQTGEKQNPPPTFLPFYSSKGEKPELRFQGLHPADVIFLCTKSKSPSKRVIFNNSFPVWFGLFLTHGSLLCLHLFQLIRKCLQLEDIKLISCSLTALVCSFYSYRVEVRGSHVSIINC